MSRLDKQCPEDCARCELLESGQVQMVPCLLDQIAARQRRMERTMGEMKERIRQMEQTTAPLLAQPNKDDEETR